MDVVALFLPDPEDLVDRRFQIRSSDGQNGKLLPQIITGDLSEFFDRVRGRAVLPAGPDLAVSVPGAVFEDVPAICNEDFVCSAHFISPVFVS